MLKKFQYQIKGKKSQSQKGEYDLYDSNWVFPPIFTGLVEAKDRKEARKKLEEEYNHKLPQRVLSKDLETTDFLLRLEEIKDDNTYLLSKFEVNTCLVCKTNFRQIDLYNDTNSDYKGSEYCSRKCSDIDSEREYAKRQEDWERWQTNPIVIYKITNKLNNQCYIGKTQRSFTLRWWEHLKSRETSDAKFHKALSEVSLENWKFEIEEVVKDINTLSEREGYYIKKYNSIDNGYNTANVICEDD